jgi:hypothetical protein
MIIDVKRQQQKTAPVHHICDDDGHPQGRGRRIHHLEEYQKDDDDDDETPVLQTLGDKIVFHLYKLICRSLLIGFLYVR